MNQGMLFDHLKKPSFYGSGVNNVQLLQTHISYVALTGSYAYKVKKPVNFGFLDFSTVDKRKYYCEEEMRLNRRLCPTIYLEVIPITQKGHSLELNGDGAIVDFALKMKEFPQERIMTNMLQQGRISEDTINRLCEILVGFYESQKPSEEITAYGESSAVKRNIDENFDQTKTMMDITIPKDIYWGIKEATEQFFSSRKEFFRKRIDECRIYDCHGDLHSGNIVVTDDTIHVFDCIEFNDRFRYCDVASDIGFLAMDLDFLNQPYLSSYLIEQYVRRSNDTSIYTMLNFYKSYRAFVRGKVQGFQLNDPHIDPVKRNTIIATAKKYFDLSFFYAQLFMHDLHKVSPLLFLVCGLSGTGKSTVARKLSVDYHAVQINTDVVRKKIAGIDQYERHHDSFNTGLYDPQNIDVTYEYVMKNASEVMKNGGNVVLDATFQKKKYREMAYDVAAKHHASLVIVQCVCPDLVVKKRLKDRVKKKSVSDGRWEIYLAQKTSFEPFTPNEHYIVLDTSDDSFAGRMRFYRTLLSQIQVVGS